MASQVKVLAGVADPAASRGAPVVGACGDRQQGDLRRQGEPAGPSDGCTETNRSAPGCLAAGVASDRDPQHHLPCHVRSPRYADRPDSELQRGRRRRWLFTFCEISATCLDYRGL